MNLRLYAGPSARCVLRPQIGPPSQQQSSLTRVPEKKNSASSWAGLVMHRYRVAQHISTRPTVWHFCSRAVWYTTAPAHALHPPFLAWVMTTYCGGPQWREGERNIHTHTTLYCRRYEAMSEKPNLLMECVNLLNVIFSCNVPTDCTWNACYYSHFTPTCFFGMTMPSAGST